MTVSYVSRRYSHISHTHTHTHIYIYICSWFYFNEICLVDREAQSQWQMETFSSRNRALQIMRVVVKVQFFSREIQVHSSWMKITLEEITEIQSARATQSKHRHRVFRLELGCVGLRKTKNKTKTNKQTNKQKIFEWKLYELLWYV